MAAGTPTYPTTLDTDATAGPTSTIVAGTTTLATGDQLGISKNVQSLIIALETKVGVNSSADASSLDYRVRPLVITTAAFTMPGYGSTVSVTVTSTAAMTGGDFCRIPVGSNSFEYMTVSSITDATHVVLSNASGPSSSGTVASGTPITFTSWGTMGANYMGEVPTPPNDATKFLNGTGVWSSALQKPFKVFQAALEYSPPASLYGVFGVQNNRPHLAFNDSASWGAYFFNTIPQGAVLTGGLLVRLKWKSITVTTGDVIWGVQFERLNTAESADSLDTQILSAASACSGTQSALVETAITVSSNIDGLTAGDGFGLLVQRVGANASDTLVGDACLRLVSVETVT